LQASVFDTRTCSHVSAQVEIASELTLQRKVQVARGKHRVATSNSAGETKTFYYTLRMVLRATVIA